MSVSNAISASEEDDDDDESSLPVEIKISCMTVPTDIMFAVSEAS